VRNPFLQQQGPICDVRNHLLPQQDSVYYVRNLFLPQPDPVYDVRNAFLQQQDFNWCLSIKSYLSLGDFFSVPCLMLII